MQEEWQLNSWPPTGKPWQGLINFLSSSSQGEFALVHSCVNPQHSLHEAWWRRQNELVCGCSTWYLYFSISVYKSGNSLTVQRRASSQGSFQENWHRLGLSLACQGSPFRLLPLNSTLSHLLSMPYQINLAESSDTQWNFLISYCLFNKDIQFDLCHRLRGRGLARDVMRTKHLACALCLYLCRSLFLLHR